MLAISFMSLLAAVLALVTGVPAGQQRVVGGSETTIETYPFSAALLYTQDFLSYQQKCGGTILNVRAVITAAHCVYGYTQVRWQMRVGSTFANAGGTVYNIDRIIVEYLYDVATRDRDLAIIHSAGNFVFGATVDRCLIAGPAYNLPDNTLVTAIGWGATTYQGQFSGTLRQVNIWTVNEETCRSRYAGIDRLVTPNMLCTGWLDVGGRDQCTGDNGSPILHNNVLVGVRSWGQGCGQARFPGVNTSIRHFTNWILAHA